MVWESVGELNSAIIVGYTLGAISRVLSFAIDEASPLAAIKDPIVIAELPRGETLHQIRTYLNEYVVMATTAGLRVGNQSTDGLSFTYGPLNVVGDVRDIARLIKFEDKSNFEDYAYCMELKRLGLIKTEVEIKEPVYHYRYQNYDKLY